MNIVPPALNKAIQHQPLRGLDSLVVARFVHGYAIIEPTIQDTPNTPMNTKSVISTIRSVCSADIKSGKDQNENPIEYIDVFEHPGKDSIIGIDENGTWCAVSNSVVWSPQKNDHFYIFFTLLEFPLKEIASLIQEGLSKRGVPNKIAYTFPFDYLVLAAIKVSNHWSELALKWLEQGYPANDEIMFQLCNNDPQNKKWLQLKEQRLGAIFRT